MKRKILSILVALCMVCSLLPLGAMAACDTCVDENGDYWCDVCDWWIHECYSEDGDIWCDWCGGPVAHDCVDEDGNYHCDLCNEVMPGHVHEFSEERTGNHYFHFHACYCGEVTDWAEHTSFTHRYNLWLNCFDMCVFSLRHSNTP